MTNQNPKFEAITERTQMMADWEAKSVVNNAEMLVEAVERLAKNLRERLDMLPEDADLDQIVGMGRMLSDEASGHLESRTRDARELAAAVQALGVRREMVIELARIAEEAD